MSVLQADFNNFYDSLFKDMRCIELILSAHKGERLLSDLPSYLYCYFDENGGKPKLKSEHETLLNFLNRTAKYHVSSIAPYLYLAQDEISVKTGDELQRRAINALKSRNLQTLRDLLRDSTDLADVILYNLSRENEEIEDMLWVSMMVYEDIESLHKPKLAQCVIERIIELSLSKSKFLYDVPSEIVFAVAEMGENEAFNHQFREIYLSVLSNEDWFNKDALRNALPAVFENLSIMNTITLDKLKNICNFCIENEGMDAPSLFNVVIPEKTEFIDFWGIRWFEKLCAYMEEESDFSDSVSKQLQAAFNALRRSISIDKLIELVLPLAQYDAFLPIVDSMISQKVEEPDSECIKSLISKKVATKLLERVIVHDFAKSQKTICHIVDGLQYEITDENAETMDEFTLNYASSFALDNILVYCGKQGFFALLSKTISDISVSVFDGDDNDDLLSKIAQYFTTSQIEALGRKIFDASAYNGNKNYERELSIIRALSSVTEFAGEFEQIATSKILVQFSSYHQNANYRTFVSDAMGFIKNALSQECIDKYIRALIARYNNYRHFVLEAINKVSMKMSSAAFKEVFEIITTQSEEADFKLVFEIIQNHNVIRPTDSDNLGRYASFLINNLPTAEDPDCILRTICHSFSSISNLLGMAVNAQKNPECSEEELAKAIAHFADRKDTVEKLATMIRELCEMELSNEVLQDAISRVKKYRKEDIYIKLVNELPKINIPQTLTELSDIACNNLDIKSACEFVISCLQMSFEKVNFIESSLAIMDDITTNAVAFKEYKAVLADVLRTGFVTTTSDNLKKAILLVVSSFKIKPQFKKSLTGENLDYYKKWTA